MYKSVLVLSLSLLGLSLVSGCASFALHPVAPASATSVSTVSVEYDEAIDANKAAYMDKLDMKGHMTAALQQSFAPGGGESLQVTITQFRTGGYGPTRMHAVARLIDASGNVVAQAEGDSTSIRSYVQGVAQDVVNQLVAGL